MREMATFPAFCHVLVAVCEFKGEPVDLAESSFTGGLIATIRIIVSHNCSEGMVSHFEKLIVKQALLKLVRLNSRPFDSESTRINAITRKSSL